MPLSCVLNHQSEIDWVGWLQRSIFDQQSHACACHYICRGFNISVSLLCTLIQRCTTVPDHPDIGRWCKQCKSYQPLENFPAGRRQYKCKQHCWSSAKARYEVLDSEYAALDTEIICLRDRPRTALLHHQISAQFMFITMACLFQSTGGKRCSEQIQGSMRFG